jgi:hypothetical protein
MRGLVEGDRQEERNRLDRQLLEKSLDVGQRFPLSKKEYLNNLHPGTFLNFFMSLKITWKLLGYVPEALQSGTFTNFLIVMKK